MGESGQQGAGEMQRAGTRGAPGAQLEQESPILEKEVIMSHPKNQRGYQLRDRTGGGGLLASGHRGRGLFPETE